MEWLPDHEQRQNREQRREKGQLKGCIEERIYAVHVSAGQGAAKGQEPAAARPLSQCWTGSART